MSGWGVVTQCLILTQPDSTQNSFPLAVLFTPHGTRKSTDENVIKKKKLYQHVEQVLVCVASPILPVMLLRKKIPCDPALLGTNLRGCESDNSY